MSRLWYQNPAKDWNEALPLGCGRMGAMVFGDAKEEHIQVNEESIWYGGKVNRINPDAKKYLPEIRRLLLAGEVKKAEKLMRLSLSGCPDSAHPYQTLGDIYFDFENAKNCTDYVRELDLENAVYQCAYEAEGVSFKREYFFSHPDDVMVMRFLASQPGKLHFSAILRREKFFDGIEKCGECGIGLYGNLGKGGFDFAMQLYAVAKGGKVSVIGETLLVEGADEALLFFSAGSTFRMENPREALPRIIAKAMAKPYEELKERHKQDYRSLYGRVQLFLDGEDAQEMMPTDERLSAIREGKDDIGLAKLYFDYGRYLLIACSRKGTLPATLQGIWNPYLTPPWDCKYTVNINTQMNYWPAEICNLSECHLPLLEHLERMVESGEEVAEKMYGCRGFVCHHNTDIWGDCAPQDLWLPGTYWVMGAAWLCTHQWTHYLYTKDQDFLRRAFPIMRKAALFFLDFLIEEEGFLKTCPSVSPENTFILPNGETGSNTVGVTMDNQILRDLFDQCIQAAEILGVEDELHMQILAARQKLLPTKIAGDGTIMEWQEEYGEAEPGHRHISHLYGLHPSDQITVDETPDLAQAARKTLEKRLSFGSGHTGWSRAWILNHFAKLWDAEAALENLRALLIQSTLPNLLDNHPPFQIDGNFGATAGIAQMLLQSNARRCVLLPALPKKWHKGHVLGLCVAGGASVDIFWEENSLQKCVFHAKADIETTVKYGERSWKLSLKAGEEAEIYG